jgi:UDP-glucose:(heptosyl)LPS alpha-1,3-glucosyltransferase
MRIALVVERFEPSGGGVEHAVWQIARGLADSGDEVHVIARRAVDCPHVTVHHIPVPEFWQPLRVVQFSKRAHNAQRHAAFDIVHSFSRTIHQNVFHAGGGSHADYMRRNYSWGGAAARRLSPRHAVLLSMERRIFSDPKQTIQCVSEMVRKEIINRYGIPSTRLPVIHYGVDPDHFDPDRNSAIRPTLRSQWNAVDATVWLLAGSGWHRKGLDTALKALAQTREKNSHLWIAGRDSPRPWKKQAEKLGVGNRVRFLGPRDDLEKIYAAADGLLLPTRYDAFGLVCLEAAASGIPVITSRAAGAAELLADAGTVLENPEDVTGFAEAMDQLSDPNRRAQLGNVGRRRAQNHDWTSHVQRLRALYGRIRP